MSTELEKQNSANLIEFGEWWKPIKANEPEKRQAFINFIIEVSPEAKANPTQFLAKDTLVPKVDG